MGVNDGFLSHVIGGWRVSAIQIYSSGTPIALMRNNSLASQLYNGPIARSSTATKTGARQSTATSSIPAVDRFLKPVSEFPTQPAHVFGNSTKYNPKVRNFWNKDESVSLAKSFRISEDVRIDLRGEAFNILNRTIFGSGNTNLNSNVFGIVTSQSNNPRQMQVALKLYW